MISGTKGFYRGPLAHVVALQEWLDGNRAATMLSAAQLFGNGHIDAAMEKANELKAAEDGLRVFWKLISARPNHAGIASAFAAGMKRRDVP